MLRQRYESRASAATLTELMQEECRYLAACFIAIAGAVAISLPVLLLPLAPASAGVARNGVYYGVYCGVFATLWAITNWDRLEFLFQQRNADGSLSLGAAEWSSFDHTLLLARLSVPTWSGFETEQHDARGVRAQYSWRYVLRYLAALALAWIAFCATFALLGLLWGASMEYSFVLYYGAPVAFTLVDCAWFFVLLPRERRSLPTFLCVGTLNTLLCAPILLLFVPQVVSAQIQMYVPEGGGQSALLWIHDLLVPTLIERLFSAALASLLPRVLRRAGLLGVSVADATTLHLNAVFEASLVMGVFDDASLVVGVITVLSIYSTLRRLRAAYRDGDPDELYLSWMDHVPGLAAPVIFLVHTTLIRKYINSEFYFIYRCSDDSIDWSEKSFLMVILLLTRLVLLQAELGYCLLHSRRDVAMVLRGGIESLWKHLGYVTFTLAFAATLFTSCFIVMHDGLSYLFVDAGIEPDDCLSSSNSTS